jgi:glutaredoxin 2
MALTGKKVLPVITWRDEENMEHTMGESLDIIEAGIETKGKLGNRT